MILLFDIDGTLVADNGLDAELYRAAVRDVLGSAVSIHEDWSRYRNVTDDGILREIAEQEGIRYEDCVLDVRSSFERRVEESASSWRPVPGAVELLHALQLRPEVSLGIATGGWRTTAKAKLNCAGFELREVPIAASDDHIERVEIMRTCLRRVESARETEAFDKMRIVYVGDGSWDLKATAHLGWEFVAVGDRLKGLHSAWTPDFSDPGNLGSWPSALLPTTPAPS